MMDEEARQDLLRSQNRAKKYRARAAQLQQLANDSKMPDEKERHAKSAQYYFELAEKEGRSEQQK